MRVMLRGRWSWARLPGCAFERILHRQGENEREDCISMGIDGVWGTAMPHTYWFRLSRWDNPQASASGMAHQAVQRVEILLVPYSHCWSSSSLSLLSLERSHSPGLTPVPL